MTPESIAAVTPPPPETPSLADREAFTDVFRRYYEPLSRYALRYTGDAAGAADVLQDVFTKLWADRERLSVEVSLKALLYTMVRNRALNRNRRLRRIARDVSVEDAVDRRGAAAPGDGEVEAESLRRHLTAWIEALPPRRREAFVLSRHHGLTHAEIARIMGLSRRTVDTHILLALRELRARLDALEPDR